MLHVVYDAAKNNLIVRVYETNAEAVAAAAPVSGWGVAQVSDFNVSVGWYANIDVNPATASAAIPAAQATAAGRLEAYNRIHRAFRDGLNSLPVWRADISGTAGGFVEGGPTVVVHACGAGAAQL